MSNILVTGGRAGFIVLNLVKELYKQIHNIIVLDNYSIGKHQYEIDKSIGYTIEKMKKHYFGVVLNTNWGTPLQY